ncbi:MAG: hypothetical protein M3R54_04380 [Chloroflexota bacterium]|nr:hypothetical protein [Chloroflexota bacterium]
MNRVRAAHQLLPPAADALARDDALELQQLFWSCDLRSDLFAAEMPPELADLVRDPAQLEALPHSSLLVVHHAAGSPLPASDTPPGRTVLIQHAGAGTDGLAEAAPSFALAIAETEDERGELAAAGFSKTAVVSPAARCDEAAARTALNAALALIDLELPERRARRVVVVSHERGHGGIYDYAVAVCEGLRRRGHQVTFIGVRNADTADLFRKLSHIRPDVDTVIIEHEAGVFRDVTLARALVQLRGRGFGIVLSMHELEPEKFHHYRRLIAAVREPPRYGPLIEALRVPWSAVRMANWFLRYRIVVAFIGGVPDRLVVHSRRSARWLSLLTRETDKTDLFPLMLRPLENIELPKDPAEKRALRARLGLPPDAFIFVSPGFFFPRKRFIEVMRALPRDAFLVLSGTASDEHVRYQADVLAEAKRRSNVIVSRDYDAMGEHVAASDCAVFFYEDVFQSGVVTQAVWAGLPCIVSEAEGFAPYRPATLVARDTDELARAMVEVQRPETQARLQQGIATLRRLLAPERLADRYVAGLGR